MLTASVIGAGMGGSLSLAGLAASPHFKLLAVADTAPIALARAQQQYPHLHCFRDAEGMLERVPTDVVCVSTRQPCMREGRTGPWLAPQGYFG